MTNNKMGFYPVHDPEMPELVEALQAHIESLGNRYAHNANLDPMEGANRISAASDLFHRVTESLQELQEAGRVPVYRGLVQQDHLAQRGSSEASGPGQDAGSGVASAACVSEKARGAEYGGDGG